jgi:hypothetical protein
LASQAEVLRWKAPRAIVNPYVDQSVVKASATQKASREEPKARPTLAASPRLTTRPIRIASQAARSKSKLPAAHQLAETQAAQPVRLAAHDPLSDPFGDRLAQSDEPSLNSPVAAQEPSTEVPPADPGAAPPQADALPMPRAAAGAEGSRTYDPSICEAWQANCERFKEGLRSDRITSISLSIDPLYALSPVEGEDRAAFRDRDLANVANPREWRSRSGELLATGRLGNLEYGRVVIVDDSGREIARLRMKELGQDEVCFITYYWQLPYHCEAHAELVPRNWMASTFTYQASALCHKPLYFEEVQLERYGHTAGPIKQPIVSGAHFFANIAVLPYKMAISPPFECEYPLGYYRPGSCAPWHIPPVPLSLRGALAEAGAWVGGIYILP